MEEPIMKLTTLACCAAAALWSAAAPAAEIKVLSAGAIQPGLERVVAQFLQASGHEVKVQFNTAPEIARRLAEGYAADILIAPPAVLDEQAKNGKVLGEARVPVGRVGAGVTVRASAPSPEIATTDALKAAVLGADALVYNNASTGIYLDRLFARLGIADALKPKTTRYSNGEAVMEHIIKGKGNEIGFGAITEIKLFEQHGLKLVGPLPADIQNYTSYAAAPMTGATAAVDAKAFLAYLATSEAKQAFAAAGIE
jgi:molybdate transport system substrate-binding protein